MLGLCEQVVEGFEFVRLHWQYGDVDGRRGQESVLAVGMAYRNKFACCFSHRSACK
jgi:hypothetical protein